jgi:hypothetical protein
MIFNFEPTMLTPIVFDNQQLLRAILTSIQLLAKRLTGEEIVVRLDLPHGLTFESVGERGMFLHLPTCIYHEGSVSVGWSSEVQPECLRHVVPAESDGYKQQSATDLPDGTHLGPA